LLVGSFPRAANKSLMRAPTSVLIDYMLDLAGAMNVSLQRSSEGACGTIKSMSNIK